MFFFFLPVVGILEKYVVVDANLQFRGTYSITVQLQFREKNNLLFLS